MYMCNDDNTSDLFVSFVVDNLFTICLHSIKIILAMNQYKTEHYRTLAMRRRVNGLQVAVMLYALQLFMVCILR